MWTAQISHVLTSLKIRILCELLYGVCASCLSYVFPLYQPTEEDIPNALCFYVCLFHLVAQKTCRYNRQWLALSALTASMGHCYNVFCSFCVCRRSKGTAIASIVYTTKMKTRRIFSWCLIQEWTFPAVLAYFRKNFETTLALKSTRVGRASSLQRKYLINYSVVVKKISQNVLRSFT